MSEINLKQLEKLREPFPASSISQKPKGGVNLDYVGHAETTDRLLNCDPLWTWEPFAVDARGLPAMDYTQDGKPVGLWIKLYVCGHMRPGYGSCEATKSDAVKELIGDAIRNAAMRFGVALDCGRKRTWKAATMARRTTHGPRHRVRPGARLQRPRTATEGRVMATRSPRRRRELFSRSPTKRSAATRARKWQSCSTSQSPNCPRVRHRRSSTGYAPCFPRAGAPVAQTHPAITAVPAATRKPSMQTMWPERPRCSTATPRDGNTMILETEADGAVRFLLTCECGKAQAGHGSPAFYERRRECWELAHTGERCGPATASGAPRRQPETALPAVSSAPGSAGSRAQFRRQLRAA